jgi:hypothetical protein
LSYILVSSLVRGKLLKHVTIYICGVAAYCD